MKKECTTEWTSSKIYGVRSEKTIQKTCPDLLRNTHTLWSMSQTVGMKLLHQNIAF